MKLVRVLLPPVGIVLLLATIVVSCATSPRAAAPVPEEEPRLTVPQPGDVSPTDTDNIAVVEGVGLSPPERVIVYPTPRTGPSIAGDAPRQLFTFAADEESVSGGIMVFSGITDERVGPTYSSYLRYQGFRSGPVATTSFTGNDGLNWRLTGGWRADPEGEVFAELHASTVVDGKGLVVLWVSGPEVAADQMLSQMLPRIRFFRTELEARVRDGIGFVDDRGLLRWFGDVDRSDAPGTVARVGVPRDDGSFSDYLLWTADGDWAARGSGIRWLTGSSDLEFFEELQPRINLGAPVDERPARTWRLEGDGGPGIAAVWHRPDGSPVSVLLVPSGSPDRKSLPGGPNGAASLVRYFNEVLQPSVLPGGDV